MERYKASASLRYQLHFAVYQLKVEHRLVRKKSLKCWSDGIIIARALAWGWQHISCVAKCLEMKGKW